LLSTLLLLPALLLLPVFFADLLAAATATGAAAETKGWTIPIPSDTCEVKARTELVAIAQNRVMGKVISLSVLSIATGSDWWRSRNYLSCLSIFSWVLDPYVN
jgi:hypothetical protein